MTDDQKFQAVLTVAAVVIPVATTVTAVYLEHRSRKKDLLRQRLADLASCVQSIVKINDDGSDVGPGHWKKEHNHDELRRLCHLLRRSHPDLASEAEAISNLTKGEGVKEVRNKRNGALQGKVKQLLQR